MLTALLCLSGAVFAEETAGYQTGDIIFQTSNTAMAKAVELATHSQFSHVGVIVNYQGELQVLEATNPVGITPLAKFIQRGTDKKYTVLRLKQAENLLTDAAKEELIHTGERWVGKPYDFAFSWSDDELYCSELVYKLFANALHIELALPKPLKSFDLSNPLVQEQLKVKYGETIPYDDSMVSPQQLYESDLLKTISSNF